MKYFGFTALSLGFTLLGSVQAATDAPLSEFGLSFVPDYTFEGSSLSGWRAWGDADWQASDGEVLGQGGPKGGWLVFERGLQDVGIHAKFKATVGTQVGVLLRIEPVDAGYRGVLLELAGEEIASFSVVLDNDGNEINREELRYAGGIMYRMAPPPDESGRHRNRPRAEPPADLPVTAPDTSYRVDDWNQIETFLETNVIRSFLNDGREVGGAVGGDAALTGFGPIALRVGGTGEVRFKDVMVKDIAFRQTPAETTSPQFEVQRVSEFYYSWGSAAADFNRDGHIDVVAGPYVYYGPEFTDFREIYVAVAKGPSQEFVADNHQFAHDVNGDGWPDVISGWTNPAVYLNPQGESRRWAKYNPIPRTQSETTLFTDIDGDGRPELVYASGQQFRYAKPDASESWTEINISEAGYALSHGIGTGDINGDGRVDILGATGWWEQPESLNPDKTWAYHPVAFGRYGNRSGNIGGSVMAVYDANGDGLNDVVTSLNAHGFGLAWYEQQREADGAITFVRHMISDDYSQPSAGGVTFSQAHAATSADLDGDGMMEFIIGKRAFTHLDNLYDPDAYGPPVLYAYRAVRNTDAPGGAEFVPELIHNRSGVGSQITALDLNDDGAVDLLTSNNRGTFIFWNKRAAK
ncbi:FG-GAP-like repeat-containing protein [Synoicihabitans lomoniglobus]|uniref:FG-GAP-like repeat-containing protein n=1 Tax=Synoicihabitans lomoniglobus TaxID=2909285 RepID=A0AAE9ZWB6_9BACT|nr:FG-GAP-like repeat-containing protein [Opitutaceae bacterium LMO-M01]WED64601.1 FG-GAP-like repeat-containing protein [Opitutaceae bacterium LMO-M01]